MSLLCKYVPDVSIHHVFSLLSQNSKKEARMFQWDTFNEWYMEPYTPMKYQKCKNKAMCSDYLAQKPGGF